MKRQFPRSVAALAPVIALTVSAVATGAIAADVRIHTGDETGAYHSSFCPVLKKKLEKDGITAECMTSAGTANNMARIADGPRDLGYGQLDVLALEGKNHGGTQNFHRIRSDDVRECLFAVAKNKDLSELRRGRRARA